ncbi:hypothetical protein JCM11491_000441 [Sporobolomyces phaffii]
MKQEERLRRERETYGEYHPHQIPSQDPDDDEFLLHPPPQAPPSTSSSFSVSFAATGLRSRLPDQHQHYQPSHPSNARSDFGNSFRSGLKPALSAAPPPPPAAAPKTFESRNHVDSSLTNSSSGIFLRQAIKNHYHPANPNLSQLDQARQYEQAYDARHSAPRRPAPAGSSANSVPLGTRPNGPFKPPLVRTDEHGERYEPDLSSRHRSQQHQYPTESDSHHSRGGGGGRGPPSHTFHDRGGADPSSSLPRGARPQPPSSSLTNNYNSSHRSSSSSYSQYPSNSNPQHRRFDSASTSPTLTRPTPPSLYNPNGPSLWNSVVVEPTPPPPPPAAPPAPPFGVVEGRPIDPNSVSDYSASSVCESDHANLARPSEPENEDDEEVVVMTAGTRIIPQDPSSKLGPGGGSFQGTAQKSSQQRSGGGGSRRRPSQFGTTGGGGKTRSDFHSDDEDEAGGTGAGTGKGGKGKGKAKGLFHKAVGEATSTSNKAKGGKSTSSSGQGHGQGGARPAIAHMSKIAKLSAGGGGASSSRLILQDQEPSNEAQATMMVQQALAKRAEENGERPRIEAMSIKGASKKQDKAGKGKGKEKDSSRPTTVTMILSSDDDDNGNESDPIEDDDLAMSDHAGPSNPKPRRRPQVVAKQQRHSIGADHDHDEEQPTSDDPLGMEVPRPARSGGVKVAPGLVSTRIQEYESGVGSNPALPPPKVKKLATSLAPRNAKVQAPPSLDGAGTQDDGYAQVMTTKETVTVAAKRKTTNNKKKDPMPPIPTVIDLAVRPYLLAREVVPPHAESTVFKLKLTPGLFKSQKVTVTRSDVADDGEIFAFKLDDVAQIEWLVLPAPTGGGDGDGANAISFQFKTASKERIMTALGDTWVAFEELSKGADNEVLFISKGQQLEDPERWKTSPRSAFEQILYCLDKSQCQMTRVAESRSNVFQECYDRAEQRSAVLERRVVGDRPKPVVTKKGKSDPMQPQLSFGKVPPNRPIPQANFYGSSSGPAPRAGGQQDAHGDWLEPGSQPQPQPQSDQAPRRSSRPSTSIFKDSASSRRLPVPAPDPYPSDHVVLEYPQGEPGSVTVTYGDKKRLNDDEFLNDTLIELGLKKAIVDVKTADESRADGDKVAPLVHVFNSFFYKKLSSGKQSKEDKEADEFTPYYLVEKWTKKFDLFDKKYVVIPINEHLHWYLAVIVNPKWIIDAAKEYPPLEKAPPKSHATRGRTSTSTATAADSISLDSSSQPDTPAGAAVGSSEPHLESKYFAKQHQQADDTTTATTGRAPLGPQDSEELLEREHERQEAEINAKLQEAGADTEMGLDEPEHEHDAGHDSDVIMADPTVEGGGPNGTAAAMKTSEMLELSDDDDTGNRTAPTATTTTKPASSASGRTPVPIGAPTAPPKGASSPPPQPEPPVAAEASLPRGQDVEGGGEHVPSAAELAPQLGADPGLADRCWIFTFDSLGGSHGAVVEKLKKYLDMEARKKQHRMDWTAARAVQGVAVSVPRQPNFCDCGLYILHYVEKFLADPAKMTEYIVSRTPSASNMPKGSSADARQKRAALKKLEAQLQDAVARENVWDENAAVSKRRTMRREVEALIEAYKPFKAAQDARDAEDKRRRDERRDARDKREAEEGAPARKQKKPPPPPGGVEAAAAGLSTAPPPLAAAKRGPGRGKKKPEEIYLCNTSDEEDDEQEDVVAGSPPKKKKAAAPPPSTAPAPLLRSPPQSQQAVAPPSAVVQLDGTSADFLPDSQPTTTDALRSPSRALVHSGGGDADDEAMVQRDVAGELDNTQPEERDANPAKRSLACSSSPPSPPPKKKKKKQEQHSPRAAAPPTQGSSPVHKRQGRTIEQVDDDDDDAAGEEEDQLDSSVEIRAPASPVLELPPPNQERLVTDVAQHERAVEPANASSGLTVTTSSRGDKRRRSANGHGNGNGSTMNSPSRRTSAIAAESNGGGPETIEID